MRVLCSRRYRVDARSPVRLASWVLLFCISGVAQSSAQDSPVATHTEGAVAQTSESGLLNTRVPEEARQALEETARRLKLAPQDPKAVCDHAVALFFVGEQAKSNATLARTAQQHPESPHPHHARSVLLMEEGEFKEALEEVELAINKGWGEADAYYRLAYCHLELGDSAQAIQAQSRALELDAPGERRAYGFLRRARLWSEAGDWDNALEDFEAALAEGANLVEVYATRAQGHFRQRQYDAFCQDIRSAIAACPGDAGAAYSPAVGGRPSDEALRHGEQQLRSMLRDRPAMAQHIEEGDALWNWTVRRFAGSGGVKVFWDPTPLDSFEGQCGRQDADSGFIRVASTREDGAALSSDEMWATAAVELHNVTTIDTWDTYNDLARVGLVTRDEYAMAYIRSERWAMQRARAFYIELYLPWLESKNLAARTSPERWGCGEEWQNWAGDGQLAHLEDYWRTTTHWTVYCAWHDAIRANHFYLQGDYGRAVETLEAALAKETDLPKQERVSTRRRLGQMCCELGDLDRAARLFTLNINDCRDLPINLAEAYHCMAIVCEKRGELEEAVASIDRSIEAYANSASALAFRARLLRKQGREEEATRDLQTAVQLDPDDPAVRVLLDETWNGSDPADG